MDFEHSAKVKAVQQRLHAFMQEHIYPNEQRYQDEVAAGDRWQPPVIIEELKRKARAAGLWNLFLPDSSRGARVEQSGIRAALRDHGPCPLVVRGLQLLGAGHRQHGDAGALRHRSAEAAMARTTARRRHSLELRHDRAGSGIVRRHQYSEPHRAPGRPLRHQRPQMVGNRSARSALQAAHRHGQDRSRQSGSSPTAVDDPGPARRPRRDGPALAARLRLRPCAPRARRSSIREREGPGHEHIARRRPRLRDRAGPAWSRPRSSLHARDRSGRSGAGEDVPPAQHAGCLRQAAGRAIGDARAHRRSADRDRPERGCWCSRPPTRWTSSATRRRSPRSR